MDKNLGVGTLRGLNKVKQLFASIKTGCIKIVKILLCKILNVQLQNSVSRSVFYFLTKMMSNSKLPRALYRIKEILQIKQGPLLFLLSA